MTSKAQISIVKLETLSIPGHYLRRNLHRPPRVGKIPSVTVIQISSALKYVLNFVSMSGFNKQWYRVGCEDEGREKQERRRPAVNGGRRRRRCCWVRESRHWSADRSEKLELEYVSYEILIKLKASMVYETRLGGWAKMWALSCLNKDEQGGRIYTKL